MFRWAGISSVMLLAFTEVHCGTPEVQPWFDWTLPRAERVAKLLAAMTTEEKIAQMVVDAPEIPRLGVKAYHWRNNVQHGLVDNGVSTQFVQTIGMAATWSAADIYAAGRVTSVEARAKHNIALKENDGNSVMDYGLDLWGPVGNLFRDPRWGRGQETYGEDPYLAAVLTQNYVDSLQTGEQADIYQTLATCKAFVAYSVDNMPPRLSFDPNITETDLNQYYFPVWESCAQRAASVMCAYNGVNGYPMCMSPMLKKVLRDGPTFNFTKPEQYIVTDSGALDFMVTEFKIFNSTVDSAAAGLNAGVDLNSGNVFKKLTTALDQKMVTTEQIDTAMTRLLHAKMAAGMFDPADRVAYSKYGADDIHNEAHLSVAEDLAVRSQVLLKNDNKTLPLSPKTKSIAVIGWGANDTYALLGNYYGCHFARGPVLANCSIVTPLHGIQMAFPDAEVTFTHGVDVESNDTSGFDAAVAAASAADVVVFVGGNRNCEGGQRQGGAHCEGEGQDRPDLQMPGEQTALITRLRSATKTLILAILTGGPIAMTYEAQHADAIIVMWYGGIKGGQALGTNLAGITQPTGRLPMTWVTGISQVPNELDMALDTAPGRTYRHLDQTPLYSFGYGMSGYTEFSYSNVKLSATSVPAGNPKAEVEVCVAVQNVGSVGAEEVVQVYAQPPKFNAKTPNLMLVAFVRTSLISAGETRTVCLPVSMNAFRLMSKETAPFTPNAGTYVLSVGGAQPGKQGTFVGDYVAQTLDLTLV